MDYPLSTRLKALQLKDWGAVISLNFDTAWCGANPPRLSSSRDAPLSSIGKSEQFRLCGHTPDDAFVKRSIWFPNGSTLQPDTIRLGLRDYGSAAYGIAQMYSELKAFESKCIKSGEDKLISPGTMLSALADKPELQSWVAHVLWRPVVLAGVGMSKQE